MRSTEAQKRAAKAYRRRNSKSGLYRLQVWIPRELRDIIVAAINKIVRDHESRHD